MRSRAAIAALLLLLLAGAARAQERVDDLLEQGNRLYEQGDWAGAADAYQRILDYGVHNEVVYFNLGNARFKQGRLGEAILNYERTLRLDPRDAEARENLDYAVGLTIDRVDRPEAAVPAKALLWLVHRTTASEDALLLLFAVYLLGGAATAAILTRRRAARRALLYVGLVLAAMALWSGGSLGLKEIHSRAQRGVILAENVDALSGPSAENTPLFTVHEGLQVEIRNRREGWVQILLPNGLNGWVPARALEAV